MLVETGDRSTWIFMAPRWRMVPPVDLVTQPRLVVFSGLSSLIQRFGRDPFKQAIMSLSKVMNG